MHVLTTKVRPCVFKVLVYGRTCTSKLEVYDVCNNLKQ